jgi:hypothetical protein
LFPLLFFRNQPQLLLLPLHQQLLLHQLLLLLFLWLQRSPSVNSQLPHQLLHL